MRIRILGSAAGGRFPQWNCACANCEAVRSNTPAKHFTGKARTQSQLALSADGSTWFLAGASPDLAFQIENSPELHPRASRKTSRDSPITGVVLGSADLDHVLGLLLLRELQPLRVYAAPSILHILREENSMFGMLNRVEPQVVWTPMAPKAKDRDQDRDNDNDNDNDNDDDAPFPLLSPSGEESGLHCKVHYLSGRYPKYVRSRAENLAANEATAALFFESAPGARVAYIPAVGSLSDALLEKIRDSGLLLFDGTFWSNDELQRLQGSAETAHQMGHIPVEESLQLLENVKVGRKMFIHLNNTNPILNEASPERRAVQEAGWEVAEDNWQLDL